MEHTGHPTADGSELVGLPRQYTTISATMQLSAVPRPRPSCNSRKRTLKDVIDVCDNFVNELEAHRRILSVSEERYTQNSVAAYADAGCSAAADWKEPAAQENGNLPKETTTGPRPGPDHLSEEPAFVTFLKGGNVLGLSPAFSRRSTVSQRLGARGSVASGELRSFLSD